MDAEIKILLTEIQKDIQELKADTKDDIQELQKDLKEFTTKSVANTRDLAWIKGGLQISFTTLLGIVGYLIKGALK